MKDTCLCLHAQRAARALARRFDVALRPFDITSGQFSLLMSLNRPAPPTIGSVAGLLAMDRTTLTANLKPLERRGLLTRQRRPERPAQSTAGLDPDRHGGLLARALPVWTSTHADIEAGLPEGGGDALRAGLLALA